MSRPGPKANQFALHRECVASMKTEDRVTCTRLLDVAPIVIDRVLVAHARCHCLLLCGFPAVVEWRCPIQVWHDTLELLPEGGPGAVIWWKQLGVRWPRSFGLDRFTAFLRA